MCLLVIGYVYEYGRYLRRKSKVYALRDVNVPANYDDRSTIVLETALAGAAKYVPLDQYSIASFDGAASHQRSGGIDGQVSATSHV